MNIVVGVGGGIAAYKVCALVRRFSELGHRVTVVPTSSALKFVGEPTWAALSGNPVPTSLWENIDTVQHVRIGQEADLIVVAPGTANLLSAMATGAAHDLLTNILLTARCPVAVAPAMHTEMWEHPATVANVATLRSRGVHVLDPAHGRLTGKDSGPGRLPEPEDIAAFALNCAQVASVDSQGTAHVDSAAGPQVGSLSGCHVLISSGGTREPLDPVRFLGNRSSGKQGVALAAEALRRGAEVTLVAANMEVPAPESARVVSVETAAQLHEAMLKERSSADVVIMAAAVADFRPMTVAGSKLKKSEDSLDAPTIHLERTEDVLADLVRVRNATGTAEVIVGFAAETGDEHSSVLEYAQAKLRRKGCDVLVMNDVSAGKVFGRDDSEVTLLDAQGTITPVPAGSKSDLAGHIWDAVAPMWQARRDS